VRVWGWGFGAPGLGFRFPGWVFPDQAKVGDTKVAVSVEEEVGGFEVAMDHAKAVYVLDATENLIGEILHVVLRELLFRVRVWGLGLRVREILRVVLRELLATGLGLGFEGLRVCAVGLGFEGLWCGFGG
jgi:hypothetical protein